MKSLHVMSKELIIQKHHTMQDRRVKGVSLDQGIVGDVRNPPKDILQDIYSTMPLM